MDDFPVKLADLLESIAGKARALTVDRVAQWTKMLALGMVAATLGLLALLRRRLPLLESLCLLSLAAFALAWLVLMRSCSISSLERLHISALRWAESRDLDMNAAPFAGG